MKRSDIRGFTLKVCGLWIEFVTVFHILRTIAVYKEGNRVLVKRWEW